MRNVFFALGTIIILAVAWPILPFHSPYTVTVTGTSQGDVANSQASFGATVAVSNADKTTAVNSVNTKMTALIKSLKDFGVADADIKTETVNVYQMSSPIPVPQTANGATTLIYPVPPQGTGNGDWQAMNSITITLRDVSKASALTDLLNNSGATNVYGPNFGMATNVTATEADLLSKAITDAKSKAQAIAKANGQSVGRMVNVQEDGSGGPIYPMFTAAKDASVGSVPAPVQPGTSTLSKTVTVTFELR